MTTPVSGDGLHDPVELVTALIACPSVTPDVTTGLDVLQSWLETLGFSCRRMVFSEAGQSDVDNLYGRLGSDAPHLCFAGHMDVVPPGDTSEWGSDPFAATVRDGMLYGRGAADMKGGIAAFVAAVAAYRERAGNPRGSVSLLITGDEEGPAVNGTRKTLMSLAADGETIDDCLVGEPSSKDALGDVIKIGRRGSMNAVLMVYGTQGHVAYPHLAENPLTHLASMLSALTSLHLDEGTDHFEPSNLELTSIDTGNDASNVIPASVQVRFNIRFNDTHSSSDLEKQIRALLDEVVAKTGGRYKLDFTVSGEAFLTPPGPFIDLVKDAIHETIGRMPVLSTGGGTSDARFIKDYARVLEFGLVGQTMHKKNESIAVEDLTALARVYGKILDDYFAGAETSP
ncbi:MAG: succinyl-diaminopimelate desuccinylase [Parvularculales bacterium]